MLGWQTTRSSLLSLSSSSSSSRTMTSVWDVDATAAVCFGGGCERFSGGCTALASWCVAAAWARKRTGAVGGCFVSVVVGELVMAALMAAL